jgi:hypothetical protein
MRRGIFASIVVVAIAGGAVFGVGRYTQASTPLIPAIATNTPT